MSARATALHVALIAVACAILAAIVHLISVLLVPHVATQTVYAKLLPLGALNQTVSLPPTRPTEAFAPFADPATAITFCHYDLRGGPLRVKAPAARSFSSVSFHTRQGQIFYALTDRVATHGLIEAVLTTPDQMRALATHDVEDTPSPDLRVVAPESEGYVLLRVFSEFPSLYPESETEARRLECQPEPSPGSSQRNAQTRLWRGATLRGTS